MTEPNPKYIERVARVLAWLNQRLIDRGVDVPPMILWVGCPYSHFDQEREHRVFAHTNHLRGVVCVHPEIGRLNTPYLLGVMAHEFGHEIAITQWDDKTEQGADRAAKEVLGLPIKYGSELRLQYLKDPEQYAEEIAQAEPDIDGIWMPEFELEAQLRDHLGSMQEYIIDFMSDLPASQRTDRVAMDAVVEYLHNERFDVDYRILTDGAEYYEDDDSTGYDPNLHHTFVIIFNEENEAMTIRVPWGLLDSEIDRPDFAELPPEEAIMIQKIHPDILIALQEEE